MITFGATRISPVNIKKAVNKKHFRDYKVNFAELNQCSDNDVRTLANLTNLWGQKNSYCFDILEDFVYTESKKKVYILTSQKGNLNNVAADKILGICEVSPQKDSLIVNYLETSPQYASFIKDRYIKGVGKALMNMIKVVYNDLDIMLSSVSYATGFYKKLGFKPMYPGKNANIMIYKHTTKGRQC